MGLLGPLGLRRVGARRAGHELGAVQLGGLTAGRVGGLGRQRRGVRTHVGDVAVLVQRLRGAHGLPRVEAELAARLLLERRGRERRGRTARVGLGLEAADREVCVREPADHERGGLLAELDHAVACRGGLELPAVVEVAARRDARAAELHQARVEALVRVCGVLVREREGPRDVPVLGRDERHALALALDDQARGHGLHAARGQPLTNLAPQDR
ncbi:hypothetical protein D3C74_349950 [compost metagenome]